MGTILSLLDKHMPLVKIQCYKPNYPETLKAAIKEKFKLWKLYKRDPENYKKKYYSLCLHIKIQIKNLAAKQEKLTLSKSVSHIYKYSNNIIRPRRGLPTLVFNNKLEKKKIFLKRKFLGMYFPNRFKTFRTVYIGMKIYQNAHSRLMILTSVYLKFGIS
jgi:hypothetical protein